MREKFLQGLIRSGRYLDRIEQVFRSYDLPVELALMPHVESSFDYSAYSKVGAAGIWQFMRSTGRRFLTVNRTIDERRDPLMATDAAARYLKQLHLEFGSWPLAVTAYNHGENGMARAKKRYGTDFRTIVDNYQSRLFGFASKNFYPELLAAVEVARNYKAYFGDIEIDQPEQFDTVALKHSYHVSVIEKAAGLDRGVLKSYNPHLTRYVWERTRQVPAGFQLRLPPGSGKGVEQALARYKPSRSPLTVAADGSMLYSVRPGNTLGQIASNFGTSIGTLQRLNDIKNPHSIRVGELLVVSRAPSRKAGGQSRYRVRPGDSLASIAKKFQTTVRQLAALNSLDNPDRILPGQMLVVLPR
ncbi:MAG: LysM peptidoglycan-binding domain-containing protein [Acidobacteriota bacterium]